MYLSRNSEAWRWRDVCCGRELKINSESCVCNSIHSPRAFSFFLLYLTSHMVHKSAARNQLTAPSLLPPSDDQHSPIRRMEEHGGATLSEHVRAVRGSERRAWEAPAHAGHARRRRHGPQPRSRTRARRGPAHSARHGGAPRRAAPRLPRHGAPGAKRPGRMRTRGVSPSRLRVGPRAPWPGDAPAGRRAGPAAPA
jgi:hypothetical protein